MTAGLERLRWILALIGVFLWLILFWLGPALAMKMRVVRDRERCGASLSADCFSDYLPVMELVFIPMLVLVLLVPVAILALSLFAPPSEWRTLRWRGALGMDDPSRFPARIVVAIFLLAVIIWCWIGLPLEGRYLIYHFYWIAVSAWLLASVALRFRDWSALRRAEA